MGVLADLGIAVVNAGHDVCAFGRPDHQADAPGGVRVGCHGRRVEKNAYGIAIKAVLHEKPVIGRDQKIVPGSYAAEPKLDAIVHQLLLVGQVDKVESLTSIDLLDG